METLADNALLAGLPENQRAALISLLADEDPAVYQIVREKILSYGRPVLDWLRPHTLSGDPVLRRRTVEIVQHLARQISDERFLDFCLHHGEEFDLEEATGRLAQTQYPDTNIEAYQALYDGWAADARERIAGKSDPEQVLAAINQYLFSHLGFHGCEDYGDDPDNCYLNRVVDDRTGNPISLCAIYLFMARRLGLPVTGIGLPGHFVCRYQSSTREIYIDAFRQGQFWTKADCIKQILAANHGLQDGFLTPVSSRRILLRMCSNLHQTYARQEMTEEAARVRQYLVALAK